MVTFAGPFRDPTTDWQIARARDENGREYAYVSVDVRCGCGHECCSNPVVGQRPHTSDVRFYVGDEDDQFEDINEAESACGDYIEQKSEQINEQYDDYLEENRYAIVQMERYEMWQREY